MCFIIIHMTNNKLIINTQLVFTWTQLACLVHLMIYPFSFILNNFLFVYFNTKKNVIRNRSLVKKSPLE